MCIVPASERFRTRPGPFERRRAGQIGRRVAMGWLPMALIWRQRPKPASNAPIPVAHPSTHVTHVTHLHPTADVIREQMHFAWLRWPTSVAPDGVVRQNLRRENSVGSVERRRIAAHPAASRGGGDVPPETSRRPAGLAALRNGAQSLAPSGYRQAPASKIWPPHMAATARTALTTQNIPTAAHRNDRSAMAKAIPAPASATYRAAPDIGAAASPYLAAGKRSSPMYKLDVRHKAGRPDTTASLDLQYADRDNLLVVGRSESARWKVAAISTSSPTLPSTSLDWRKMAQPVPRTPAEGALEIGQVSHPSAANAVPGIASNSLPVRPSVPPALDPAIVERLADDVIRRIERRSRIERERRGL